VCKRVFVCIGIEINHQYHIGGLKHVAHPNRTLMGERIIIEQEGKAAAAIITYVDLQRFEAVEALLEKAEQESCL